MSHEVLYRKYRPLSWHEVKGQDLIVRILQKQISEKKVGHAYLFYGSRGTGKTTVARIFASALGCFPEDIYEIDAASHRKVEEVAEIRNSTRTLPFRSPYSVYILDEVHMLSDTAFNSLLKTLEEPPAHVIFILATTELRKIPDTIISRVQVCTFGAPSRDILAEVLAVAAEKEGYRISSGATALVASLGKGAFRDAYGILEKVLLLSEKNTEITRDAVLAAVELPQSEVLEAFMYALLVGDREGIQTYLSRMQSLTEDGIATLEILADIIRSLLYYKLHGYDVQVLSKTIYPIDEDFAEKVKILPKEALVAEDLLWILDTMKKVQYSYDPKIGLELLVYRYFE